jgi:NAD(P)-dependent dehydrogenase (short-subunit alcohol dehydrogenase family)
MSRLAKKVAVVVGSGSGIGAAIAERFAAEGAHVYATSRTAEDGASRASSGSAGSVRAVRADAGSLVDLEQVFARVRSEEGRIDILVVNAGVSEQAPLGSISEDHFDRIFGLNVRALVFAAQGAPAADFLRR